MRNTTIAESKIVRYSLVSFHVIPQGSVEMNENHENFFWMV